MFAGSYDGLRENRKIETESFMMAATLHVQILEEKIYQKEMKSICVRQWINYFKDLKIKEWRKEKLLDLKKENSIL